MIAVIIVSYNAKATLIECVRSVLDTDAGMPYRLVVYDNGSTDGTAKWLAENSSNKFEIRLNDANLGFPGAANIAAREIKEDILVFLDDDAAVSPGWLQGLYAGFSHSSNVGIVGCKFIDSEQKIFFAETRCGPLRSLRRWEIDCGQGEYTKETDALIGACWMMKRELFTTVGDFDERFFPCQFEDTDYCLRTRLAGYKIVYQGFVKLLHTNLLRAGGSKILKSNSDYFYEKWHWTLEKFPLEDSHPVDRQMSEAIQKVQERDFERALELCEVVRAQNPLFVEPKVEMAALLGLGRREEGELIAKELLRLNPTNFIAGFNLFKASAPSLTQKQKQLAASELLDSVERMLRFRKGER